MKITCSKKEIMIDDNVDWNLMLLKCFFLIKKNLDNWLIDPDDRYFFEYLF